MKKFNYNKGYTHGGIFHADDVFSTAFLMLLNPSFTVSRGYDVPNDKDIIVYDIGGGEFDHHGREREMREDTGIYYASFGKLWREYADILVSDKIKSEMDKNFVSYIDNADNTSERYPLSDMIYSYNPFWDETVDNSDTCFNHAVELAKDILSREIEKYKSIERATDYVLECYNKSEDGLIIMDKYAPWFSTLHNYEFKAIAFPSNRGGWNIERVENSGFEFPTEWWGTREEKVKGLLFCHSSGFMCNFKTKEDIVREYYNILFKLY